MKSLDDNIAKLAAATAKAALAKELVDLVAFSKSAAVRIERLIEYITNDDVVCADKAKDAVASAEATVVTAEIALASATNKVDEAASAVAKDLTVLSGYIKKIQAKQADKT